MSEEKTKGQELKEKLFNKKEIGWKGLNETDKQEIFDFCDNYINFLNECKTERESIKYAKRMLQENGFKDIAEYELLNQGDKVYYINREKSLYAAIIGKQELENGLNIIGAHVDSPRIDLKPNPLYESSNLALFKTHYYGGIKKYQWTAIPISIHGVIVKSNGEKIELNIGEENDDIIFTITDLLPHLARKQMGKSLKEAIEAEDLNLLVGSIPFDDEKVSEKVKLNILSILNEKYGITEVDFLSSELELVPAFKAKSSGFDRSLVAGYGQDDRVCAYNTLKAITNAEQPEKTVVCILSDKEEVGSMGNTGMESNVFDTFISEILNKTNQNRPNMLDKLFCNSKMLSADVDAAYDPNYPQVCEKMNSAYVGMGLGLNKYTGSGGKYNASDANAEFVAWVRQLLETNNIRYQISELGKVDEGGGGTIAYILANKGIDVIDAGVPVLSMHSPYEVTSKFDVYQAYKAYLAFYNSK